MIYSLQFKVFNIFSRFLVIWHQTPFNRTPPCCFVNSSEWCVYCFWNIISIGWATNEYFQHELTDPFLWSLSRASNYHIYGVSFFQTPYATWETFWRRLEKVSNYFKVMQDVKNTEWCHTICQFHLHHK